MNSGDCAHVVLRKTNFRRPLTLIFKVIGSRDMFVSNRAHPTTCRIVQFCISATVYEFLRDPLFVTFYLVFKVKYHRKVNCGICIRSMTSNLVEFALGLDLLSILLFE